MSDWQPIETAPRDRVALFVIVPKVADESYTDTNGRPIVVAFTPYVCFGRYGCWSSLSKATHWMHVPDPPAGPRGSQA